MVSDRSRKQALEEKNREILSHLETIVQNLGEGLLEFDENGRILSSNPMARTLLGFSEEELAGGNALTRLSGGEKEREARIRMILRQVCANRTVLEENGLVFFRKDGQTIDVQGVFSPSSSDGSKGCSVILFAFRDAGPKKRMEAELRASEVLNRGIVEHSPDGIFLLDPVRLVVMEGNIRFARLIGLPDVASLRGLPVMSFATRTEKQIRQEIDQLRSPGWEIFETSFRRPEGRSVPVSINAVPIPYKGQDAVLVTVRDITFRRQVEQSHLLFLELDRLILEGTPPRRLYQTITDRLVSIFPFVHVALFREGPGGEARLEAVSSRDPVMQMEIVREGRPFGPFFGQDFREKPFSEALDLSPPWNQWQEEGRFGILTRLPFLFSSDRPAGVMEISLEKGEALGDALKTLLEDIQGRLAFFCAPPGRAGPHPPPGKSLRSGACTGLHRGSRREDRMGEPGVFFACGRKRRKPLSDNSSVFGQTRQKPDEQRDVGTTPERAIRQRRISAPAQGRDGVSGGNPDLPDPRRRQGAGESGGHRNGYHP